MNHTKEPWKVYIPNSALAFPVCVSANGGHTQVTETGYGDTGIANALRIVRCVNACKNLTDEELDDLISMDGITLGPLEAFHEKACKACKAEKADVIITDKHELVGGDGAKKYFFDGDNKTDIITKRYQCGRCKRILHEDTGHGWCPYCGIQLNWQPLPEAPK